MIMCIDQESRGEIETCLQETYKREKEDEIVIREDLRKVDCRESM
jgi:hypothetical protein